ncbi:MULTISPECIES: endonuclease/exonuclease/phosphatase family protein [unclassified Mesorhizobium]|uniref:endonuclease/exonuclease/phosphatase family protein n=1 Tax=unclassified Mesorhizobium TaxID=325217 RepID=UPI0030152418
MSTNDIRNKLTTGAFIAVLALSLPLIAGFFGRLHPVFDSFAHFRVHLAVLMAIAALPLLASKYRKEGATALLLAVAAFATTSSSLGLGTVHAGGFQPKSDEQPTYKLLQLNLRYNNAEPNKVLSLIGRLRPDVVTLEEVSDMWKEKLALLSSAYPYSIICPYPNRVFGVAILSSRPMADGAEANCYERGSFAVAPVNFSGKTVEVAALHLGWPWPFEQSRQISAVAQPLSLLGGTALLAGDFNATPWSAATARVGKLGDLTMVPSVGPTWQSWRLPEFLRFAGLPIDQVFHKGDVIVNSAHTLAEAGSDHLPVLVEFSLKPTEKEQETVTATVSAGKTDLPNG